MHDHSSPRMRRNADGIVRLAGARFAPVCSAPPRMIFPPTHESAMRVLSEVRRGEVLPPDTHGPARGLR